MRIGIEAQRIFRTKKHGMDIVALEIIKALQIIDKENSYFIFVKKGSDICLEETENFKIVEVPGLTYADWEQIFLPIYALKYKLDILHCTSNTAPLAYKRKSIVTLHDVIFLENNVNQSNFSWYQNLGRIYRKAVVPSTVKKAERIITVSQFEKNQILNKLKLNPNKVDVVYNAFGKHFNNGIDKELISNTKLKYNLPESYIFYIGNTDPKKNIFKTIRAYRTYCIGSIDPLPLVIADINEVFLDLVLEQTDTKSLKKNIVLTGYIFNQDLPAIYAGSVLFLYPSLRESFGIPVLEAMACSIPVITSNISALPEIAGDAAKLVDPANEKSIGNAIIELLSNQSLTKEMVLKGLKRSELFNWNISANNLLNIYKTA
jgi:glycosyltransferase involved in cell wall biosynthesis